jgi:hypothetical protein
MTTMTTQQGDNDGDEDDPLAQPEVQQCTAATVNADRKSEHLLTLSR